MGSAKHIRKRPVEAVDIQVGQRIRMRRLMLEMTQEGLAAGLGLTFQQLQKYEKGSNRVSASRLQQIAQILQVPISYFFDEEAGHPAESQDQALLSGLRGFISTREGLDLALAFRKIEDNKLRRRVVDLVEHLATDDSVESAA